MNDGAANLSGYADWRGVGAGWARPRRWTGDDWAHVSGASRRGAHTRPVRMPKQRWRSEGPKDGRAPVATGRNANPKARDGYRREEHCRKRKPAILLRQNTLTGACSSVSLGISGAENSADPLRISNHSGASSIWIASKSILRNPEIQSASHCRVMGSRSPAPLKYPPRAGSCGARPRSGTRACRRQAALSPAVSCMCTTTVIRSRS